MKQKPVMDTKAIMKLIEKLTKENNIQYKTAPRNAITKKNTIKIAFLEIQMLKELHYEKTNL